mmetsp:Transcript_43880/g.90604  ORF Transcript_43880/g.90604 Transcript_43880/m.90604 type:complete len:224 (+) Transcript_43880:483-1154(+)
MVVLHHHAPGDQLPLPQEHGVGDQGLAAVSSLYPDRRPRHHLWLGSWTGQHLPAGHHCPDHLHPQGHGLRPDHLGLLHHLIPLQRVARVHSAAPRQEAAFQHLLQAHQLCSIHRNRLLHHGHCPDVWHAGYTLRRGCFRVHEGAHGPGSGHRCCAHRRDRYGYQVNYLRTRTARQSLHLAASERYSQAWSKDPATLYRCKSSFYTAFCIFRSDFDSVKTRPCS